MAVTPGYDTQNNEIVWYDSTASSYTEEAREPAKSNVDNITCMERIPGGGWLVTLQYTDKSGWHIARYSEDFTTEEWTTSLPASPVDTHRGAVTDGTYAYVAWDDSGWYTIDAFDITDGSSVWSTGIDYTTSELGPCYPMESGVACCWAYEDTGANMYINAATVDQSGGYNHFYEDRSGYDRYQMDSSNSCYAVDIAVDPGNNYFYLWMEDDSTGTAYVSLRVLDSSGSETNGWNDGVQSHGQWGNTDFKQNSASGLSGIDFDFRATISSSGMGSTWSSSYPSNAISFNKNDTAIGNRSDTIYKFDSSGNVVWENSNGVVHTTSNEYPRSSVTSTWNEVERTTVEAIAATQTSASAGMQSGAVIEKTTATQVTAAGVMQTPALTEFTTSTQVNGAGTMQAPVLTESTGATQVSSAGTVRAASITEHITGVQITVTGGMHAAKTLSSVTATQFTAGAAINTGGASRLTLDASPVAGTAGMHTPTGDWTLSATPVAGAATMHDAGIIGVVEASQVAASASPSDAGVSVFIVSGTQPTATAHMSPSRILTTATATQFTATGITHVPVEMATATFNQRTDSPVGPSKSAASVSSGRTNANISEEN